MAKAGGSVNEESKIRPLPRWVSSLLFAALCSMVVAVFMTGFGERAATTEAIATAKRQIAAFDVRLARLMAAPRTASGTTAQSEWIVATTRAVAAASIQEIVGAIVAKTGSITREVQIREQVGEGQETTWPAAVSAVFLLDTTHAGIRQILLALHSTRPLLKTEKLSIIALSRPPGDYAQIPLEVEIEVTGYWTRPGG